MRRSRTRRRCARGWSTRWISSWMAGLAASNRPPWWISRVRHPGSCALAGETPRPSAADAGLYNARMPEFSLVQKILLVGVPLLFAITVHEVAHGWMANKLGDPTARMLGR